MAEEPEGSAGKREALGTHVCSTLTSSITQGGPGVGGGGEGRRRKKSLLCRHLC